MKKLLTYSLMVTSLVVTACDAHVGEDADVAEDNATAAYSTLPLAPMAPAPRAFPAVALTRAAATRGAEFGANRAHRSPSLTGETPARETWMRAVRDAAIWTTTSADLPAGWLAMARGGDVVLSTEVADGWSSGPAAYVSRPDSGRFILERSVAEEALPPSLRAFVGQAVTLWRSDGAVCRGVIDGLALRSEFIDYNRSWWGDDDEEHFYVPGEEDALNRRTQPASDAWGDGKVMLLGTVKATEGTCTEARFATLTHQAQPVVFSERKTVAGALKRRAVRAFRALPLWAEVQAEFRSMLDGEANATADSRWDAYDGWYGDKVAGPKVRHFVAEDGRAVLLVSGHTGEGCGDAGGDLDAVFEIVDNKLVARAASRWSLSIRGFVDFDNDGVIDVINGHRDPVPASLSPKDAPPRQGLDIPDHTVEGCPC